MVGTKQTIIEFLNAYYEDNEPILCDLWSGADVIVALERIGEELRDDEYAFKSHYSAEFCENVLDEVDDKRNYGVTWEEVEYYTKEALGKIGALS